MHQSKEIPAPSPNPGHSGELEFVVCEKEKIAPPPEKYFWSNVPALGNNVMSDY